MEKTSRRARRVWLFMLVCALHGALGWLLITSGRVHSLHTQPRDLELLVIAPTRGPLATSSTAKPRAAAPRAVKPEVDANSSTPSNPVSPPVDWNAELSRAGRAASGIDPKRPMKDFGFPTRPPTTADYPQFDWDYARRHRVESIPGGGVVIHLNDNCVLVLNPLPFAACSPFKRKANGELFKHLHDPDKPRNAGVP